MSAFDEKLKKALAENPENIHGLIRRAVEQERLMEMLARICFDATHGSADWEGGGLPPDWQDIKARVHAEYEHYEVECRRFAHDLWRVFGHLGFTEAQMREWAVKYYADQGEAIP